MRLELFLFGGSLSLESGLWTGRSLQNTCLAARPCHSSLAYLENLNQGSEPRWQIPSLRKVCPISSRPVGNRPKTGERKEWNAFHSLPASTDGQRSPQYGERTDHCWTSGLNPPSLTLDRFDPVDRMIRSTFRNTGVLLVSFIPHLL
ncbi:hypothetical protein BDW42DRAFT_164356 [Aspergillus taichungensis]|uniref:Uncharacterized protein n=1 Tax=Aspergillus taichungensis TaxID=482145 RepID=A0A2J5I1E0_9EURO|nr:hypothetical protein BDW42DRAFT_164356 [Aspergillus taichungensis]